MALDLEDQEQLDEFKAWWNAYGKLTINLVLLCIAAYVAWQGYQYFQDKKALEASDIYQAMMAVEPDKTDLLEVEANKLMDQYAGTPYAGRAAVYLAKSEFQSKKVDAAKSHLQWAVNQAKESAIQAIASIQLATLHLDGKDYAAAEKALENVTDAGYIGIKESLLGDVYLAQDKKAEAKAAYEKALANLDAKGRLRLYAQQKLDALGG